MAGRDSVVVGTGIGAYFVFFNGSGMSSPDDVVAGFARAYTALERDPNATTLSAFDGCLCPHDIKAAGAVYGTMVVTNQPGEPGAAVVASAPQVTGDVATFTVTIGDNGSPPLSFPAHLVDTNETWLVCDTM